MTVKETIESAKSVYPGMKCDRRHFQQLHPVKTPERAKDTERLWYLESTGGVKVSFG